MEQTRKVKCELYHDSFQNWKRYPIQKAQLVIADVPYALGNNAYASNPMWYNGGDNKNGESEFAGKQFFPSDQYFNLYEYFHFCNQLLKKEPKKGGERGKSSDAPCMVMFCSFEQIPTLIDAAKKHGFVHNIPLVFIKNYSAQVLKANMKIVGATEYGILLYRDKLPKFRNEGKMVFNWMKWEPDPPGIPKCHKTQKPQSILRKLIAVLTDEGDTVIDPVAGSGSTLRAAKDLGRNSYGFEIYKPFYKKAVEEMLNENYGELLLKRECEETGQMSIFDLQGGDLGA